MTLLALSLKLSQGLDGPCPAASGWSARASVQAASVARRRVERAAVTANLDAPLEPHRERTAPQRYLPWSQHCYQKHVPGGTWREPLPAAMLEHVPQLHQLPGLPSRSRQHDRLKKLAVSAVCNASAPSQHPDGRSPLGLDGLSLKRYRRSPHQELVAHSPQVACSQAETCEHRRCQLHRAIPAGRQSWCAFFGPRQSHDSYTAS
mmetsp:Transcript_61414/g.109197  ORF Transcript_61414/g.109197 Transcript_61414/m.109197 type:complete len:205 (-) Transcript_61414:116-730(-)